MPHTMEWYIPHRILRSHVWGRCTDEDILDFTTEMESMPPIYLMLPRAIPTMHFKNRGESSIRRIFELTAHIMTLVGPFKQNSRQ